MSGRDPGREDPQDGICKKKTRVTAPERVAVARRIFISRARCTTDNVRTLAIPRATATTSANAHADPGEDEGGLDAPVPDDGDPGVAHPEAANRTHRKHLSVPPSLHFNAPGENHVRKEISRRDFDGEPHLDGHGFDLARARLHVCEKRNGDRDKHSQRKEHWVPPHGAHSGRLGLAVKATASGSGSASGLDRDTGTGRMSR